MPEIKRIGSTGWVIDQLLRHYESGQIKGITIQILNKDGSFQNLKAGNMTYIETIGMIESAKDDFRITRARNIQ